MVLVRSHEFEPKPLCQGLIACVAGQQRPDAARVINRERQEPEVLQIPPVQDPLQEKDVVEGIDGAQAFEVAVLQAAAVLLLDIKGVVREAVLREAVHNLDAVGLPGEPEDALVPSPDVHFRVGQDDLCQNDGILVELLKHHRIKLVQELQI